MNKDIVYIGCTLLFIFIITMAGHMLYVEGYAIKGGTAHAKDDGSAISVFSSQEECEKNTGASCVLQLCDHIPEGKDFEDVCGQGFKKGWQPRAGDGHSDTHH